MMQARTLSRPLLLCHRLCSSPVRRNATSAFLFPGQGSQVVGMTQKLAAEIPEEVGQIFQTAERVLGYDLHSLCLHGPQSLLDETVHCQPAVVVASLAAAEYLKHKDPDMFARCTAAAGFSVGEFTALMFAGALSLEQGLQLIKVRAEGMQSACLKTQSTMVTLIGLKESAVGGLCSEALKFYPDDEICIANYLFPKGYVISGSKNAVLYVSGKANAMGSVVKQVAASGAFHSSLMKPAIPSLQTALEKAAISMPRVSVYSNVTGQPYSSVKEIRTNLLEQVTKPVLWESIIRNMLKTNDHHLKYIEIGPGTGLRAMLKRIDKSAFQTSQNVEA